MKSKFDNRPIGPIGAMRARGDRQSSDWLYELGNRKTILERVLEHFSEYHPRGGGCSPGKLRRELQMNTGSALAALWRAGKLNRRLVYVATGPLGGEGRIYKYYAL